MLGNSILLITFLLSLTLLQVELNSWDLLLEAFRIFWLKFFCIPKKVIIIVDASCRKFIWTGLKKPHVLGRLRVTLRPMAGLTWKTLWSRIKLHSWNYYGTLKIRKIDFRSCWMHSFYIKYHDLMNCPMHVTACWCAPKFQQ